MSIPISMPISTRKTGPCSFPTTLARSRCVKSDRRARRGSPVGVQPMHAQGRWRCVNASHLVALVRAGATFVDGLKVEREDKRNAA